jgi:hypothetical protein
MHKTVRLKLAAALAEAYHGEWDQITHHRVGHSERGKGL